MDNIEFLRHVLPDEGHYCLWATDNTRKPQKFYDTTEELLRAGVSFDQKGFHSYFALATFKDRSGRTVDNISHLKSFFLDLDCGDSKGFPSQKQALEELKAFLKSTGLPRPTTVSSGRGIHVYWALKEPVTYDEWVPVAEALKRTCRENGFPADPAITADGARVLRIPGTHNHKDEPPKPVMVLGTELQPAITLDDFTKHVGPIEVRVEAQYIPGFDSAIMDRMMGNRSASFDTIVRKTIKGKGCKQLAYAIANQNIIDEPLWRATLSIAQHCSDRDTAIHKVSNKHPQYDYDDTEAKARRIKGPYLCERFEEFNAGGCDECPLQGKIKSPIVIGQTLLETNEPETVVEKRADDPNAREQQYTIPKYPAPYTRGSSSGGVYLKVVDEEGEVEHREVYHNDLYVVRRMVDPEDGHCFLVRLHLPKDGVVDFVINQSAMFARDEFRKVMAKNGVTGSNRRMDDLGAYIMKWIEELQENAAADVAHRQFGWLDSSMQGFVLGDRVIYADRVEFNPPSKSTVGYINAMVPRGSRKKCIDILDFFNRKEFDLHQIIIGTAFGSPLMQLASTHSALMHIHSDGSGFGKTTTAKIALGIYGQPTRLITNLDDTRNSRMNRLEVWKNLPFVADEISNWTIQDLSSFAYGVTEGRQKARMSQSSNAERFRGEDWRLLAVSTSNAPFVEKIMAQKALPKAEAQRVIEIDVEGRKIPGIGEDDSNATILQKQVATQLAKDIDNNFGHLGEEYIQYVIQNLDTVKKLWAQVQDKIDAAAGLSASERFMSEAGTAIITGCFIAKQMGLIKWDLNPMFAALVRIFKQKRNAIEDMGSDIMERLAEYLADNYNEILRIKSTDDMRGADKLAEQLVVPDSIPRNRLTMRYETDTSMLYISKVALREWCTKKNLNFRSFEVELRLKMKAKTERKRMSKGTHMDFPPITTLAVKLDPDAIVSMREDPIELGEDQ